MGTIGENIKNFRTFRGIKQQDLADMLGRTKSVISNWERGANSPDVEICEKLCKILRVTPNELFGWEENQEYVKHQEELQKIQKEIDDLERERYKINSAIHKLQATKAKLQPNLEPTPVEERLARHGVYMATRRSDNESKKTT